MQYPNHTARVSLGHIHRQSEKSQLPLPRCAASKYPPASWFHPWKRKARLYRDSQRASPNRRSSHAANCRLESGEVVKVLDRAGPFPAAGAVPTLSQQLAFAGHEQERTLPCGGQFGEGSRCGCLEGQCLLLLPATRTGLCGVEGCKARIRISILGVRAPHLLCMIPYLPRPTPSQ